MLNKDKMREIIKNNPAYNKQFNENALFKKMIGLMVSPRVAITEELIIEIMSMLSETAERTERIYKQTKDIEETLNSILRESE